MSWTNDPELEEMFRDEVASRSAALVDGAVRLAARDYDAELTADMYREGHSVKGTSRVMGFEALSVAGKLLESTWRSIDSGDLEWDADIADALLALAEALPDAVAADRALGTPDMSEAIEGLEAVLEAFGGVPPPSDAPPADTERRQPPLMDPVPFDVSNVDEAVTPIGHESPEELAASYDPFYEDDGPSTLDMLRARRTGKIGSDEALEQALAVPDPAKAGVEEPPVAADPPGDTSGPTPPDAEAPSSPEIAATSAPRRLDPADYPERVDLASLALLPAVEGFDIGGLLGAVQDWATDQTMTVSAGRLYRMINGLAALRVEAEALLHKAQSHRLATGIDSLDLMTSIAELTSELAAVEMQSIELTAVPVNGMLTTVPQLVGFISRKLGKEVRFETTGGELLVDRAVIDVIGDPIRQLVVNAVRHGIETPDERTAAGKATTGLIAVDIELLEGQLQVTVSDDGAGVDWETVGRQANRDGLIEAPSKDPEVLMPVIFSQGFSTVVETELGGSGNGLGTVAQGVESLFGRLSLQSDPGQGTVVRFTVPTSRALQRIVIVEDGGLRWGIPDAAVDQIIPLSQANVDWEADKPQLRLRDTSVPLYAISQVIGGGTAALSEILVVSHRAGTAAFAVGKVEVIREVATKELGPLLQGPRHITGAALLGGGDLVLVLDPFELVERARQGESSGTLNGPRLLIVDDSAGVRAVVAAALTSNGFVTSTVNTVAEAVDHLAAQYVEAVVVDYSMPGEDGVTLVRKIRSSNPDIPIVMLSGVADVVDQRRALDAGANAFLDKSDLREGALAATLHHLLARVPQKTDTQTSVQ